jgi:hypothetical protein
MCHIDDAHLRGKLCRSVREILDVLMHLCGRVSMEALLGFLCPTVRRVVALFAYDARIAISVLWPKYGLYKGQYFCGVLDRECCAQPPGSGWVHVTVAKQGPGRQRR